MLTIIWLLVPTGTFDAGPARYQQYCLLFAPFTLMAVAAIMIWC